MLPSTDRLIRRATLLMVVLLPMLTGCPNLFSRLGPPDAVTDLVATAGDNTVTLSWTNPTNADFDHCEITYGPTGGTTDDFTGEIDSAGTTINDLTNGTEYTFTVTAVDRMGTPSTGVSETATPTDTSAPAAVTELTATAGDCSVTLTWTNPADADFDNCEISYGPTGGTATDYTGTISAAGTTIDELTNGTEYAFTVTTFDEAGNHAQATETATPQDTAAPGAVRNLTADAEARSISLSWNPPTDDDLAGFFVTVEHEGATQDPVELDVAVTTYTLSGLSMYEEYTLKVGTIDDDGLQGPEESVTVVTSLISGAYLLVGENRIYGTFTNAEYSVDGGSSWHACDAANTYTTVTFAVGDEVWIREAGDAATERFLGTVSALSGVDIYPSGPVWVGEGSWSDTATGNPGDSRAVKFNYANNGTVGTGWQSVEVVGYLSPDQEITTADTELFRTTQVMDTTLGEHTSYSSWFPFTVPAVTAGEYYVGVMLDTGDAIAEIVEDNNTSLPATLAEFRVGDPTALDAGAIKVVNSWGTLADWQKVGGDGHYWITYRTLKQLQSNVYYYYNDFSHVYEPTVLAVFEISHAYRDDCYITVGLGNPANPVIWKDMQPRFLSSYNPETYSLFSGPFPFPENALALDISEFAYLIDQYDLFLRIENSGASSGTVDSFSVEFYSDYSTAPFKTISGETGTIAPIGTSSFTAPTQNALTAGEMTSIEPLARASIYGTTFNEYTPTEAELQRDMALTGVYQPGTDYNVVVGGHGTGLAPPTEERWRSMVKLSGVSSTRAMGTLPDSVDLSTTQYFPPIGDQGAEGSCVAFSMGYYIHTYQEAREHVWDLSTTSWSGSAPSANLDKIMSPDFVYHQINDGVDDGSSYFDAVSLLTLVGASSWQEMPYDTADHSSWPSENAYRDAAQYRGRDVGTHFWNDTHLGYFTISTDADIDLLKQLLNEGYAVSISVYAGGASDWGIYDELDANDVVDDPTLDYGGSTNHANTVVGYKEGTAWDPANPDG